MYTSSPFLKETLVDQLLLEMHVEAMIERLFTQHQIVARCHNEAIWVMRFGKLELLCLWTGRVIPTTEATKRRGSPLAQLDYFFMTPADSDGKFSQVHIYPKGSSPRFHRFPGIVRIKRVFGHLAIGFDQSGTAYLLNGRTGEMMRKC